MRQRDWCMVARQGTFEKDLHMKTLIKTVLLVVSVAVSLSVPSGTANAGAGVCWREYQACIAAGYDVSTCEAAYWDCRGIPPPVRVAGGANAVGTPRDDI